MEVLGVEDFKLLFITELAAVEGRRPEGTTAPKHKKEGKHGLAGEIPLLERRYGVLHDLTH